MTEDQDYGGTRGPSHTEAHDDLDLPADDERATARGARGHGHPGLDRSVASPRHGETNPARASAGSAVPRGSVVVGIDGSTEAHAALRWAVQQAELTGAHARAIAVWHEPPRFGDAPMVTDDDVEQEATRWLRAAVADLPGAEISTTVEHGDPSRVLLDQAADAELLVLGNHGRGALSGAMLGSVAQRCVQRAPCPVLLVPAPLTTTATPTQ